MGLFDAFGSALGILDPLGSATIGSLSGGKGAGTPPDRTLYGEGFKQLESQRQLAPEQLALLAAYLPQYAGAQATSIQDLLLGTAGGSRSVPYVRYDASGNPVSENLSYTMPATPGIGAILDRLSAQSNFSQRGSDVADVMSLGPAAVAAFRNANPQQAALLDELNKQASGELAAGTSLTPSLQREVQQYSRAGQEARGLGFSGSDAAEEAMTLGSAGLSLQQQRRAFAEAMTGINTSTGLDPFMAILGRPSAAFNASGAFGSQAQAAANQQGGFNPQTAYAQDLFNTNFNAQWSNVFSKRNYDAAITGAIIGAVGNIVGGGAKAFAA